MRYPASAPKSGVTLLELLVCIAVLAILSAMTLPGLGNQVRRQRLQHAAETLAADIVEARFLAAQRGRAVHVQALNGPEWCWSISLVPGCDCSHARSCQVHNVNETKLPGVHLLNPMTLRIDPSGVTESRTHATFESSTGERLRVEVSPQGRAHVCASKGDWPRLPAC